MRTATEPTRRLRRPHGQRWVAGVAAGIAEHLRLDPVQVRVAFAVLSAFDGFGVALYAAFWVFMPAALPEDEEWAGPAAARRQRQRPAKGVPGRRDPGRLVALGMLGLGALLLLNQVRWGLPPQVLGPALVAGAGLVLLWSQVDDTERRRFLGLTPSAPGWSRRRALIRVAGGLALVVVALMAFVVDSWRRDSFWGSLAAPFAVVVGLGLVTGPFVWRLLRQLEAERRRRMLQQHQADLAAHLHDSVLQTLALIQRQAEDPKAVTALARAQERDLRSWLFDPPAPAQGSLRTALDDAAAAVEQTHGTPVDIVLVGDRPLDERLNALVRAALEAMVNAARHSGAPSVDVYAECAAGCVEVFVRDRGCGFDPDAVPADRMGLAGSVVGRMRRHGGSARVRSGPAQGTEIALTMPDPPSVQPGDPVQPGNPEEQR
jgi:signal transduction histidine kinase/phage shock protein PspC (stress-responsive transcriptional regulator)